MAARRNNHQEPDLDGQLRDRQHRATGHRPGHPTAHVHPGSRPGGRDVAVATSLPSRRWHSSPLGGWLTGARPQHHERLRRRSGRDRLAVAGRPSGVRGRPGRCQTRHAASRRPGRGRYVAGDCCGIRKTRSPNRAPGQSVARPQRLAKAPSHMTCPVHVSLSGAIRTAAPGAGAKNPPSLRRSEVYPLVFPPVLPGTPVAVLTGRSIVTGTPTRPVRHRSTCQRNLLPSMGRELAVYGMACMPAVSPRT